MNVLHIDSSILGDNSVSRKISAALVQRLRDTDPGLTVKHRDLGATPLAPLSGAYLAGLAGAAPHDDALTHDLAAGSETMEEFLAADIVVIGAPMYNFTVSSQLKAWIDRIVVAGKTFRYTEHGPEGLAKGKRVLVAISRGGIYSGASAMASFDCQEPLLRAVFGFLGINDIKFFRAEGLALGPDQRTQSLAGALREVAMAA